MDVKKYLPFVLAAFVLGGGGGFVYKLYGDKALPWQMGAAQDSEGMDDAAFNKKIREIMDRFLADIAAKVLDYKKQRKVITELASPHNMINPDYIEENYQMMLTQFKGLQQKADAVMDAFLIPEKEIRAFIGASTGERETKAMEDWRAMRNERATPFLEFFASEQQAMGAYANLVLFYGQKKGTYTYDESVDGFLFRDSADKRTEEMLRSKIVELEARQSTVLKH